MGRINQFTRMGTSAPRLRPRTSNAPVASAPILATTSPENAAPLPPVEVLSVSPPLAPLLRSLSPRRSGPLSLRGSPTPTPVDESTSPAPYSTFDADPSLNRDPWVEYCGGFTPSNTDASSRSPSPAMSTHAEGSSAFKMARTVRHRIRNTWVILLLSPAARSAHYQAIVDMHHEPPASCCRLPPHVAICLNPPCLLLGGFGQNGISGRLLLKLGAHYGSKFSVIDVVPYTGSLHQVLTSLGGVLRVCPIPPEHPIADLNVFYEVRYSAHGLLPFPTASYRGSLGPPAIRRRVASSLESDRQVASAALMVSQRPLFGDSAPAVVPPALAPCTCDFSLTRGFYTPTLPYDSLYSCQVHTLLNGMCLISCFPRGRLGYLKYGTSAELDFCVTTLVTVLELSRSPEHINFCEDRIHGAFSTPELVALTVADNSFDTRICEFFLTYSYVNRADAFTEYLRIHFDQIARGKNYIWSDQIIFTVFQHYLSGLSPPVYLRVVSSPPSPLVLALNPNHLFVINVEDNSHWETFRLHAGNMRVAGISKANQH